MSQLIDRHRDDTSDAIRTEFEDLIYENYSLGRMQDMLQSSRLNAVIPRDEYFRRDARGDYITNAVKLLWIGYKLFRDAATPVYYGARMWGHWARVNDRALAELPKGYTVSLNMASVESGGFYVGLADEAGELVEYPDPPQTEGPGGLFKIIDSAVDAAIAEAKRRSDA